ncbi:TPA: hypothetical protein SMQ12_002084 [Proteus mirabilis]|nr:hypothetical protein [Proteus mirabilis]HEK1856574.1 hypothetical protein [Proteus mirabilis]
MKKKRKTDKLDFIRGWNRHIYSVNKKKRRKIQRRKFITCDESYRIFNPEVEYIEKISKTKKHDVNIDRHGSIKMPKIFSLYTDPEKALSFICSVTKIVARGKFKAVTLNYSNVDTYCLGAECLLGLALIEARKVNSNFDSNIAINGVYPKNTEHLEIIRDVGLVKELSESKESKIEDSSVKRDNPKQRIFKGESIGKEKASAYAEDTKNKAAQGFTNYLSKCLGDHKLFLNEKAAEHLTSCMGELLDNAERHCGIDERPRWYLRGYVDNSSKRPVCELSIFNFGRTIAETFSDLPLEHFSMSRQITPYVEKHKKKNGMFEEGLITVAALQGRVSCKNMHDTDSSGTGTIELLKFFQDMHDQLRKIREGISKKPMISLISGRTHIVLDGSYDLKVSTSNDGESENYTYPFNEIGLEQAPDKEYLRKMKKALFPGVMVNIRFPLEEVTGN